jgi:ribosomal protein S18 acetylase RimI-like enzyme
MSVFNGVFRTSLDSRLSDAEIDRRIGDVVAYLRSRGVPFGWWVMPDDHPADLRSRLIAHGFVFEGKQPAMALDLDRLGPVPEMPQDVKIEEIRDVAGLAEHTRLMAVGFELPSELETAFRVMLQGLLFGPGTSVRYFLALEQGQPIATSLLCLAGGTAGIFNVATVPEARGRGVGALVTDAALRAAREIGYRIAVLESSGMGYNVYRRLGFEEYGQIEHFAWPGEADT